MYTVRSLYPRVHSENGTDCGTVVARSDVVGVAHTPSIAFRHLPPKEGCRKPVLGVWVWSCVYSSFLPRGFSESGSDCGTVVVRFNVVGVVLCIQFVPTQGFP